MTAVKKAARNTDGIMAMKGRMVPIAGLELATYRLQGGCSTN